MGLLVINVNNQCQVIYQLNLMDFGNHAPLQLSYKSATIDDTFYSHVMVHTPPQPLKRNPSCIICVLDISGSMDNEATQGQSKESDGFSRLDLVKHSVNTIIHSLESDDYLGIVTFSQKARVDLQITQMNEEGKKVSLDIVSRMKTQGATNLWDGIKVGLQQTKRSQCKNKNTYVVVLSDGQPNQHPPKGQLQTVRQYIHSNPLICSMSMFGYGYNLDTKLLSGLTQLGGGCYGYIPDCSMVGTVFVNFLSTVIASLTPEMTVEVKTKTGKMKALNGQQKSRVKLGPVQYGTKRNILLGFKDVKLNDQYATVQLFIGNDERPISSLSLQHNGEEDPKELYSQYFRFQEIKFLENTIKNPNLKEANQRVGTLIGKMKDALAKTEDEYLSRLLRDYESKVSQQEGQLKIAVSKQEYWSKWGVHYFPALQIAHQIEMCTNFKDPGIQLYSSPMFKKAQNTIDTVFIKLPPPQPTIKKYDKNGNLKQVADMADYYDDGGGCIGCDSMVKMADGTTRKASQLKVNDEVQTHSGKAEIKCIIQTKLEKEVEMIECETGLLITKYHPILKDGKWQFPVNVYPTKKVKIPSYYNFVLTDGYAMIADGIACATLGHGLKGDVIEHDYLGTKKVIEDLEKVEGWRNGHIKLQRKPWKRNPVSHIIEGLEL